jgi:hypothetical protein
LRCFAKQANNFNPPSALKIIDPLLLRKTDPPNAQDPVILSVIFRRVCEAHETIINEKEKKLLLRLWVCGREARECCQAVYKMRQHFMHSLSTRPEGLWLVR